ncbi:MAG: glycosyltransferase [Hymenobacter sp.]
MLPSYREGTPKTLLEAAACGKPLVTTDVPGCRETVQDGHNGYLCQVRDAADLAAKAPARGPPTRRPAGRPGPGQPPTGRRRNLTSSSCCGSTWPPWAACVIDGPYAVCECHACKSAYHLKR